MAGVQSRDFDSPDETRNPDKKQVDVVRMGVPTVGRSAFEPGCALVGLHQAGRRHRELPGTPCRCLGRR
jgi:hypothetical protein